MTVDDVLTHFGVQGMKWGKHKQREEAYRQKLTNISKNRNVNGLDVRRFKYRNQNVAMRFGKTAASATAQMIIGDILTGKIVTYPSMSKVEMAKKILKITSISAGSVVLNDALAKSASKRYTDKGRKVKGVKDRIITKEDAIEIGVKTAIQATQMASIMRKMKVAQASRNRARNEEIFNKWGGNILTERVDNVVWRSSDFSMEVIDNRGR